MFIGLYFQTSSHILHDRLDYCDELVFLPLRNVPLAKMILKTFEKKPQSQNDGTPSRLGGSCSLLGRQLVMVERAQAKESSDLQLHAVHRILALVTSGKSLHSLLQSEAHHQRPLVGLLWR